MTAADPASGNPENTGRLTAELLAGVRQELRTPINLILGYTEMLLEAAESPEQRELVPDLERIHAAGSHLLVLANDFLDPAKMGNVDLAFVRHELRTPLNQILGYGEMLQEEAEDAELDAMVPDLQRIVDGARTVIELINTRLADTPAPAEPTPAGAPVAPPPGPVEEARAAPARQFVVRPLPDNSSLLVVDDNEANRDMLSRRLQRLGCTVAAAENGRQALEMLAAQPCDLILLDILMPEMDGYTVLRHLKGDEKLRDIPVVVISGLDDVQGVARCIELGAEDYLPKPFDPVILQARIAACLEQKRLRDKEIEYLRQVASLTTAAAALEAESFEPDSLAEVVARPDELGQLARVFSRMAGEVRAREQRLKQQVQELRIEIDEAKKAKEVAEITDSEYFRDLRAKIGQLRRRGGEPTS